MMGWLAEKLWFWEERRNYDEAKEAEAARRALVTHLAKQDEQQVSIDRVVDVMIKAAVGAERDHWAAMIMEERAQAVRSERERCARVAEVAILGHYVCGVIAAAIRKGEE